MKHRQTIAVVGAGAVGSYYGGRLAEAGHDVRFLMRRDYDSVRDNGLRITSPDGDFILEKPAITRTVEEIGPVDWVICSLKSTALQEARRLVEPCLAEHTRVIVLMNGLGLEQRFAEWFAPQRVFGGMVFACINRGDPGHIHHLAYGPITLGHIEDDPAEIERAVALWQATKVITTASESLLRARWEKLCWNLPFNGVAVAGGGITTDLIVNTPDLRRAARSLMEEVIAAGNADLAAHSERSRIDREAVIDRMFAFTETMGPYRPSTMIDFVEGRAMEIEAMFAEPLRRAQALGVHTPQMALLTALLQQLNAGR